MPMCCDMELYIRVQQFVRPTLMPLTATGALEDELANITGMVYVPLPARFCPMCGVAKVNNTTIQ